MYLPSQGEWYAVCRRRCQAARCARSRATCVTTARPLSGARPSLRAASERSGPTGRTHAPAQLRFPERARLVGIDGQDRTRLEPAWHVRLIAARLLARSLRGSARPTGMPPVPKARLDGAALPNSSCPWHSVRCKADQSDLSATAHPHLVPDHPRLRRDWPTSAPGVAYVDAGTGQRLRRGGAHPRRSSATVCAQMRSYCGRVSALPAVPNRWQQHRPMRRCVPQPRAGADHGRRPCAVRRPSQAGCDPMELSASAAGHARCDARPSGDTRREGDRAMRRGTRVL
jgi:hypothetical protein